MKPSARTAQGMVGPLRHMVCRRAVVVVVVAVGWMVGWRQYDTSRRAVAGARLFGGAGQDRPGQSRRAHRARKAGEQRARALSLAGARSSQPSCATPRRSRPRALAGRGAPRFAAPNSAISPW